MKCSKWLDFREHDIEITEKIRTIVQESDTAAGRAFDLAVIFLILVSVITFTVETLPGLSPAIMRVLQVSEVVITLLFTLEYVLRIVTSSKKWSYIFSFYGLIDLIAILPFYLSMGVDLRSIRIVRLFRIFRILKIAQYNQAMARLAKAFMLARHEILIFLGATLMLLYFAAVGIYYFEHAHQPDAFRSIFDGLWWAVATLTTVGYGDVYPVTVGGKLFTFVILICGMGIVAVPAGLIAAALSKVVREEDR